MNHKGIDIFCPHCHGDLKRHSRGYEELVCADCHRQYPVVLGIPDLRIFPDPYINRESDYAKGRKIAARSAKCGFEELIDYYYSITPAVPKAHAQNYKRGLMTGVARDRFLLQSWDAGAREAGSCFHGRLLEIGCGTAPLLVAAAEHFDRMVGVDISFRWLVVAKKRLEEVGLDTPLICACAEALPLRSDTFDTVVIETALENFSDQTRGLSEGRRVLRQGGLFCVSTPNRFTVGPDPHIGLPAAGYLPEGWIAAYSRRRGAVPPKRNLLSAGTLRRSLVDAGFVEPAIRVPAIAREQRAAFGPMGRLAIDAYHLVRRTPILNRFLRWVGPVLHAVTSRPRTNSAETPRTPTRSMALT